MEQGRIGSVVYTLAFPKEGFYSKDMQAIGWFFMRLREVGELQILDQCYDLLKVTRPAGGQIFRTFSSSHPLSGADASLHHAQRRGPLGAIN